MFVQESIKYIIKNNPKLNINEDKLFDGIQLCKNKINVKILVWKNGLKIKNGCKTLDKN